MPNETDIGDAALGGNEDPTRIRVEYGEESRIQDPEKAHTMALAGKDVRDEAHHLKGVIQEWQENKLDETGDLQNQASKLDYDANRLEEEAGRQYDAEQSRVQDPEKAHVMALEGDTDRTRAARLRMHTEQSRGRDLDIQLSESVANGLEDWAGVLHDHPVSKEYEEAHPEVRFTPEGLLHTWHLLQYRKDELARIEEEYASDEDWGMVKLPVRLQTYVLDKPPIPVPGSADYEQRLKEAELEPELANLLSNPNTTLDELRGYFKDLEKKQLQGWVDESEKVLDDVRSGRTGEQVSPESPNN